MAKDKEDKLEKILDKLIRPIQERLTAMDSKWTEHLAGEKASIACLADHELILRGPDKRSGLVGQIASMQTEQRIVFAILGTIGITSLGGVLWLVQNTITLMQKIGGL